MTDFTRTLGNVTLADAMKSISSISDYVRSVDAKICKSKDFKSLNFMVTYKCTYELPINTVAFTYKFEQPIELSSLDDEFAVVDIETYYSFPNVSFNNDRLRFSTDGCGTSRVVIIPTGAYCIRALNTEINDQLSSTGDTNKIQTRNKRIVP